jgi:hypothetical protein
LKTETIHSSCVLLTSCLPTIHPERHKARCSRLNERIGLKATVEPRATCPESRLFGHVAQVLSPVNALAILQSSTIFW